MDFGGADEVVFGEAADGVGGVAHGYFVVAEVDVGVVVFAVGDEGGGVYEGEGFVVVSEFEGAVEDVVDDGPVGDFGEEKVDLGVGEGRGAGGRSLHCIWQSLEGMAGPFGKGGASGGLYGAVAAAVEEEREGEGEGEEEGGGFGGGRRG